MYVAGHAARSQRLVTKLRHMAKGIATLVPPVEAVRRARSHTGGTVSGRYCYGVWLRHLVRAHDAGLDAAPASVGELGPGDSLGIGLAALLSGCRTYVSLDVVRYANVEGNLSVLDELVELFEARAPIPGHEELPEVWPRLDSYDFPRHVLDDDRLASATAAGRVERIRRAVEGSDGDEQLLRYIVPWQGEQVLADESLDAVLSQAVLEHVDDVPFTHRAIHRWLKPGGWASHTVDCRSHGWADSWNGHWSYSDIEWKLVRGARPWILNRYSCSQHIDAATAEGFEVASEVPRRVSPDEAMPRHRIASRLRPSFTDDDLRCDALFLQLSKPLRGHPRP
jgi:Methyltransferase domain